MNPCPTPVFDTFWQFAFERQRIFWRRLSDPLGPWTFDPILKEYRFTNVYRVCDRLTQFLISEVQYGEDRSQSARELFFRTLLFKIFNRIETWEELESQIGPVIWESIDLDKVSNILNGKIQRGIPIYSAAYIMPSPALGFRAKHENHLALLARMMSDRVPDLIARARSLSEVYDLLLSYPGIGRFLAFQYAIDLNYSSLLSFNEADFVIAGPGAIDGLSKCFGRKSNLTAEGIIYWTVEHQAEEFKKRGLSFMELCGRPLQPIDCQNVYCELSKYARLAHPSVLGISRRNRVKRRFRPSARALPRLFLPPKWPVDQSGLFPICCPLGGGGRITAQ
jgi:hypothetical protein